MAPGLFGANERAAAIISTDRRHQGLFLIFYACCNGEGRPCAGVRLSEQAKVLH